jgi:hypothetical protein
MLDALESNRMIGRSRPPRRGRLLRDLRVGARPTRRRRVNAEACSTQRFRRSRAPALAYRTASSAREDDERSASVFAQRFITDSRIYARVLMLFKKPYLN